MKENWQVHWKDYYEILQINQFAEPEVVAAAFNKLAEKYHPDHNKNSNATERMKLLNEAFDIIGNPVKRKVYDANYEQLKNRQSTKPTTVHQTTTTATYATKELDSQGNEPTNTLTNEVGDNPQQGPYITKTATLADYILVVVLSITLILVELFYNVFSAWHVLIYVGVLTLALAWEKWFKQYMTKTLFRIKIASSIFLVVGLSFYLWAFWVFKDTQPSWYYVFSVALVVGLILIWLKNLAVKIVTWFGGGMGRGAVFSPFGFAIVMGLTLLFAAYVVAQPGNLELGFSLPPIVLLGVAASIAALRKNQRREEWIKVIQEFGIATMILIFFSLVYFFEGKLQIANSTTTLVSHQQIIIGHVWFWVTEISLALGSMVFVIGCIDFTLGLFRLNKNN